MTAKYNARYYRAPKSNIATEWRRQTGPDGGADFGVEKGNVPPQWVLDRMAEEKITGGYRTRKDNLCDRCHTYRSVNGACEC